MPEADVCICAGDVSSDLSQSLDYLLTNIAPVMPVVLTLGNHEYYGLSIDQALDKADLKTRGTDIHVLEDRSIELGGVRFIGATLWTDFEIPTGEGDELLSADLRLEIARKDIRHHALDFSEIYSDELRGGMVDVDELRERHLQSRVYIERELAAVPHGQKTVVVTHHAPLKESLDWRFDGNLSNAAYASDLSDVIAAGSPTYWIHGHIHRSLDYVHGQTRIIDNPRGLGVSERNSNGFQPGLVIEL